MRTTLIFRTGADGNVLVFGHIPAAAVSRPLPSKEYAAVCDIIPYNGEDRTQAHAGQSYITLIACGYEPVAPGSEVPGMSMAQAMRLLE